MWHHASAPPGREELFNFLRWLVVQVTKSGVDIRLGTEATSELLAELAPDVVVVAGGGAPSIPDIPGNDRSHVLPATEALEGRSRIGRKVVIVGGGGIGIEVAPYLAQRNRLRPEVISFLTENDAVIEDDDWLYRNQGHEVTMTTRQKRIGSSVGPFTRWVLAREIEHSGVKVEYGATVREITEHGVIIERDGVLETIAADTVLLAGGLVPSQELLDAVRDSGISSEIHSVGESEGAHHAIDAVRDAYVMAMKF
jgi:2,4-dienoyl-CoA reductase (NADPH2)